MEQIVITDEALPILKSGIALKEKLLKIKAANYRKRLRVLESKYKMNSAEFSTAFAAGQLSDDEEWFDWLFLYDSYKKILKQKKIIKEMFQ